MAVIGKIREKSTLLLIMIGGAMLAFVLGDALSSRVSVFGNQQQQLGEIDGVEISGIEFDTEVQKQLSDYKEREQRADIPESVASQIREQVWSDMLQKRIMGSEYQELGLAVSSKELADLTYGSNPHPQVKQAFTNPETGVFNSADVIRFIKNLDNDETGKTKSQWLSFEGAIKKQRQVNKYNTMIMKGLYVTTDEARAQYNETNKKMSINYIVKPYNAIPDSSVTVSEKEISKYYEDHPQEFKQEKIRNISYVSFGIIPSPEDSLVTKEWIDETYGKFKKTENDSLFVSLNSDREFDYRLYSKNMLPEGIDSTIMDHDSVGYMEGPFLREDGTYRIIKISQIKHAPDSVKARHIVLSTQKANVDSALVRADSLKKALENGADFAELARLFSEDPSNKDDTGNLGWFQEKVLLKAINDTCFSPATKTGDFKIIQSQVGVHIFQVLDKSPVVKKVQLAIVERKIEPSRETYDSYFVRSNQFSIELEGGKPMEQLAQENRLQVQTIGLRENDNDVSGMPGSRPIVRWAYNSEEGTVSEPFNTEGNFVVAKLTDVKEEGTAPLDKVMDQAKSGAVREKKAEQLMASLKGTDLNQIASDAGLTVQSIPEVSFAGFSIPKIGFEPEVLGKIFSLKEGDLSLPMKGRTGVYVVQVQTVTEAVKEADLSMNRNQMQSSRQSRVSYQVFEALKENANVKDNRYLFY